MPLGRGRGGAMWLCLLASASEAGRQLRNDNLIPVTDFVAKGGGVRAGVPDPERQPPMFSEDAGVSLSQCGFASQGSGSSVLDARTNPVWQKYTELHARERTRGCAGRYVVWTCDQETTSCGGLGDQLRGISAMLQFGIASGRALLLKWEQKGTSPFPYENNIFLSRFINWTVPENCAVLDESKTWEMVDAQMFGAPMTALVGRLFSADQVVSVSTNLLTPRFGSSNPVWDHFDSEHPGLTALSKMIQQPVGCTYLYMFLPSNGLTKAFSAAKKRMGRNGPLVSIHVRTGDQHMPDANVDGFAFAEAQKGMDIDALQQEERVLRTAPACLLQFAASKRFGGCKQKPAFGTVQFFSDRLELKQYARKLGFSVTSVVPLHVDKSEVGVRALQRTWAEALLLADSDVIATSSTRDGASGFSEIGKELAWALRGRCVEVVLRPDGSLCEDHANDGQLVLDRRAGVPEPHRCTYADGTVRTEQYNPTHRSRAFDQWLGAGWAH